MCACETWELSVFEIWYELGDCLLIRLNDRDQEGGGGGRQEMKVSRIC